MIGICKELLLNESERSSEKSRSAGKYCKLSGRRHLGEEKIRTSTSFDILNFLSCQKSDTQCLVYWMWLRISCFRVKIKHVCQEPHDLTKWNRIVDCSIFYKADNTTFKSDVTITLSKRKELCIQHIN